MMEIAGNNNRSGSPGGQNQNNNPGCLYIIFNTLTGLFRFGGELASDSTKSVRRSTETSPFVDNQNEQVLFNFGRSAAELADTASNPFRAIIALSDSYQNISETKK